MAQIVAIVSDSGLEPSDLFSFHAKYYAPAVDKYIVVTQQPPSGDDKWQHLVNELPNVQIIKRDSLPPFMERDHDRFDARKDHYEEQALERCRIGRDWFVLHLDLDEFHVYPTSLASIVQKLIDKDEPALLGYFRDRLKLDNDRTKVVLPKVNPHDDLGSQFPCRATYARDMMDPAPCEEKIMIARRDIILGHGRHHVISGGLRDDAQTDKARCWGRLDRNWGGDDFYVYHFRWTDRLIDQCKKEFSQPEHSDIYIREIGWLKTELCRENGLLPYGPQVKYCMEDGALPLHGLSAESH